MGSLSLVYMRRLDAGKPCAALPRQNGPHNQHRYPRWKSLSLSLDRQCITETENRDRLHVDWSMSASGLPLFDKTVPQSFKALLVLRFRFAEQQTAVALE